MSEFTEKPKREQANVFRKAAILIEHQPILPKHTYKDQNGNYCTLAAILVANDIPVHNYGPENNDLRWNKAVEYLGPEAKGFFGTVKEPSEMGDKVSYFEQYNNMPSVTKEVAAKGLRSIARAIEHGGKFGVR